MKNAQNKAKDNNRYNKQMYVKKKNIDDNMKHTENNLVKEKKHLQNQNTEKVRTQNRFATLETEDINEEEEMEDINIENIEKEEIPGSRNMNDNSHTNTPLGKEKQNLQNQNSEKTTKQNNSTTFETEDVYEEEEIENIENIEKDEIPWMKRSSQYITSPSLQHLLKETEKEKESFIKKCSMAINLTDIDKPRNDNIPTIQELKDFSDNIKIPRIMENNKQEIHIEEDNTEKEDNSEYPSNTQNENFTEVVNKKNKSKVIHPDSQRSTRASTKVAQAKLINPSQ